MMSDSVQKTDNANGETKLELRSDETSNHRASVASQTEKDGNVVLAGVQLLKTLDANRYATKKTIAQGMLDIALLTANASQLKYILQVGHKHEFYTLMLSLIIISIVLQATHGLLCVFLGSKLNINKDDDQEKANKTNNFCLALNILVVVINVIISAFDMRDMNSLIGILNFANSTQ